MTAISPDGYSLDNFYLARPAPTRFVGPVGRLQEQRRALPDVPDYFRTYKPRFLAVWGKNDPFFLPHGAEAFRRDIPGAMIHFFETGHFALETHAKEIAAEIRDFFAR